MDENRRQLQPVLQKGETTPVFPFEKRRAEMRRSECLLSLELLPKLTKTIYSSSLCLPKHPSSTGSPTAKPTPDTGRLKSESSGPRERTRLNTLRARKNSRKPEKHVHTITARFPRKITKFKTITTLCAPAAPGPAVGRKHKN